MANIILDEAKLMALIGVEFEKLNIKIDRLNKMIMQLLVNQNNNLGDWLTEDQAKELLNIGNTSMWGLRKTKKLAYSKIGGRVYYNRQSIMKLLEKGKAQ